MKKIAFVLAACLVACGASDDNDKEGAGTGPGGRTGGGPDIAAARAKLGGDPTADLTRANASAVAKGTKESASAGEEGMALGGMATGSSDPSGGGLGTRTLRVLTSASPLESCPDVQADKESGTCACASGEIHYEGVKRSDSELDLTLRYDACKVESRVYDGVLAIGITKTAKGAEDYVFAIDATIDDEPVKTTFAIKDGKLWHAVEAGANGERVLVELGSYSDGDGQYTVHAKNGTFECDLDGGEGECADAAGGEEIEVSEK